MGAAWERHAMCESAFTVLLCEYKQFPTYIPNTTKSMTSVVT